MRWQRRGPSEDLEDRRGESPAGGGGMRFPLPGGRLSLGGAVALIAVMWFLGIDPSVLLNGAGTSVGLDPNQPVGEPDAGAFQASPQEEELVQFVSFVLDDLQTTWAQLLPGYHKARLVLFRDATHSACGTGQSEMGPFYCPGDEKVYIDLSFYGELRSRFGAPGDFAQAYVLAHEVGHHIQRLTGVDERVRGAGGGNEASVRMELQADCFAGVWAKHTDQARHILEQGDIESALRAAASVGDDTIQKRTQGYVVPDSFTHGSAQQRVRWFQTGFATGSVQACDTFGNGATI